MHHDGEEKKNLGICESFPETATSADTIRLERFRDDNVTLRVEESEGEIMISAK
jgi:hypothetical protein